MIRILFFVTIFPFFLYAQVIIEKFDYAKRNKYDFETYSKVEKQANNEPPVNMSLIGQMTYGHSMGINSQDSLVYYSNLQWVVISNQIDPANPVVLTRVRTEHYIDRIYVVKNLLYVVFEGHYGFTIIDVTDPYNPEYLGEYDNGVRDIALYDRYVYTACGSGGMNIWDVTDPANCKKIKNINSQQNLYYVFIEGDYLYRSHGYTFEVYQLIDPLNPKWLSNIDTDYSFFSDIFVDGNIFYCVFQGDGFWIVDVTNKNNIKVISKIIGFKTKRIAKKESRIYITNYLVGCTIYDVSDIENPDEICSISDLSHVNEVHINDNCLYVSDNGEGIYIFDISNQDSITFIRNEKTFGYITDVAIKDKVAFLSDEYFGVRVIDISNPKVPFEIGWFQTPGKQQSIFVDKNYLFLSDDIGGLRIYDIADVYDIQEVSIIENYQAKECVVKDTLLILSAAAKGLRIFNISDIYNPVEINHFLPDYLYAIYDADVQNNFAYLLNLTVGIHIIDISDPYNIIPNSDLFIPQAVYSFDIFDNFLFVAVADGSIYVYDISDPNDVNEIYFYDLRDPSLPQPWCIKYNRDLIYYDKGHWGIIVLNIEDKMNVYESGSYYTDSIPQKFLVNNDTIYVADMEDGMYILKYEEVTGVEEKFEQNPQSFSLYQNYPNPFNNETVFKYNIEKTAEVDLTIYNSLGQKVKTLIDSKISAGTHSVNWLTNAIASGVYFYRLTVSNQNKTFTETKKCLLIK